MIVDRGFTLALGGGGARGWAHIGVVRALERRGLRPARVIGTSMGAIIGAGLAAGRSPEEMERVARGTRIYQRFRRRGRFALFDPRPAVELICRDLGDPRIEELELPLAITTYDLVAGRPLAITEGRLTDALLRSIAVPLMFPPMPDARGVWIDAGPWESMPISLARAWAPGEPVVGVYVDTPKPPILASRWAAGVLRRAALRLGMGHNGDRLTARRYLALLASRWAEPVHHEDPDLLIAPSLGLTQAWQFSRVRPMIVAGEREANAVLQEASVHG